MRPVDAVEVKDDHLRVLQLKYVRLAASPGDGFDPERGVDAPRSGVAAPADQGCL